MDEIHYEDRSGDDTRLAGFWSQLDDKYDTFLRDDRTGLNHPIRKKIYDIIWRSGFSSVLDCGCASGLDYEGLQKAAQNVKYYGIDATPKMIEHAHKFYPDGNFKAAIIQNIPYHNNQFGVVYCKDVLEHIPDYRPAIHEMVRVSKQKVLIGLFLYHDEEEDIIKLGMPTGRQKGVYQNRLSLPKLLRFIKDNYPYYDINLHENIGENLMNEPCMVIEMTKRKTIPMDTLAQLLDEKVRTNKLHNYWRNVPDNRLLYKPLLEWMEHNVSKNAKILEGGCGISCIFVSLYNRGYDIKNFTGIDHKKMHIDLSSDIATKLNLTTNLIERDAHETGFDDGSFDFVGYLNFSYFTKINIPKLIEEGKRITKKGGYFAIDVGDKNQMITDEDKRIFPVTSTPYEVLEMLKPFEPVLFIYPHDKKFFAIAQKK